MSCKADSLVTFFMVTSEWGVKCVCNIHILNKIQ